MVKKHETRSLEIVTITPKMAAELLELNNNNRPLSDNHVNMISNQIVGGKWKFNGDTIKIADDNDIVDGQHRLWAVVNSNTPIETVIVRGVEREAFATIDTLRKPRSGGDTLAYCGLVRYRNTAAAALGWLIRYQRGVLTEYKAPKHRIQNSDIEEAYRHHPQIETAVERATVLRSLVNPSVMGFFYYVLVNQNAELAETMMSTLENPAGVSVNDPFFRLRAYFTADHHQRKDPVVTTALSIKAANASYRNEIIKQLNWKSIGKTAEPFPILNVSANARSTRKTGK